MASVSVGLFTYNRPDDLRAALQRLADQTYRDLEIIVSDNASTDPRVGEVLDAIRDPRVTVYRQTENIGAIANAEFVRSKGTGQFFLWCSDDDEIEPTFIERMVELLRANPDAAMAFCDFEWRKQDGSFVRRFGIPNRALASRNPLVRAVGVSLLGQGTANLFYSLYRRDQLQDVSLVSLRERFGDFGLDVLFLYEMLKRGALAWCPEVLYRYTTDNEKLHDLGLRMPSGILGLALYTGYLWLGYARLHLIAAALARGGFRVVVLLMTPVRFVQIGVELARSVASFAIRRLRNRPV